MCSILSSLLRSDTLLMSSIESSRVFVSLQIFIEFMLIRDPQGQDRDKFQLNPFGLSLIRTFKVRLCPHQLDFSICQRSCSPTT